jgi:hypothetical protein
MNKPTPTTAARVVKLGYYSNSQNGVIVSRHGIAPCVCGGGKGHDTDVPKILIEYNE